MLRRPVPNTGLTPSLTGAVRLALLRGRVSGVALAVPAGSSPGAGFGQRQTMRWPPVALYSQFAAGCRSQALLRVISSILVARS